MKWWNTQSLVCVILTVVVCLSDVGDGKGGGGGGGRGGGGGLGGRGAVGGFRSGGGSKSLLRGKFLVPAAAGVAGYAYGSSVGRGHRFHTNPNQNPAFLSGGGARAGDDVDYKLQESTFYGRKEGIGMSAFGILALILGIIAGCTLAWYCYVIGVPVWKDRQQRNRRRMEGHPLQETPSTATPSP